MKSILWIRKWASVCLIFTCFIQTQLQFARAEVPKFKKVIWIWLENTPSDQLLKEKPIAAFSKNYPSAVLTQYLPLSKVTQANAMAMITGSEYGISDNEVTRVNVGGIVGLLESKNIAWNVYSEDYPGQCYLGANVEKYYRYRVPFVSLMPIQSNRFLCSRLLGFSFLENDLKRNTLPMFSIVIPALPNGVNDAASFLEQKIGSVLLNDPNLVETTIFITTVNQNNSEQPEMFSMVLGDGVAKAGQTVSTALSHYETLKTLELGLNLGHLNQNDLKAEPILGIWK